MNNRLVRILHKKLLGIKDTTNDNKTNVWKEIKNRKREDNTHIPLSKENNNIYAIGEEKANILTEKFNDIQMQNNGHLIEQSVRKETQIIVTPNI